MYNIYWEAINKRKKRSKKGQKKKEIKNGIKYLSKPKKIEGYSKTELEDILYKKLKNHLFINITKRHLNINKLENQLIVDLSSCTTSYGEDNISILLSGKEDLDETEEKKYENKLIRPILE